MFNCSSAGSCGRQLLIRWPDGFRHLILDLHGKRRTAGLAQERTEELGRASLALAIVGHQKRGKGHQSRSRLPQGHAAGQLRTGRFPAAGARQAMPLVFGDVGLDLRQFPHLVPKRFGIAPRELFAAAAAFGRLQRLHLVARLSGQQRAIMFLVPSLSATFLLRPSLRRCWFGMGCTALGGNEEFCGVFRPCSSCAIRSRSDWTNARTAGVISASSSGGIASGLVSLDGMVYVVPEKPLRVQINFSKNGPRAVNGYLSVPCVTVDVESSDCCRD